jgi:uncharacterized protein YjbI with pentapeptide repeats
MLICTAPTRALWWSPDRIDADLRGAALRNADFTYAVLSEVKLEGAAF